MNKQLPRDWSLNFKAESRQLLFNKDFHYEYLLTDFSLITATKIGIRTSIAAGYLIRIEGVNVHHRSIQMITFLKRYPGFRLSHRLLTDQTFKKDINTEFRFRYRLSSEIPLEGLSLDPREFFLKINNEYLNSFQDKNYDLEIRAAALLGYALLPNSKIEIGIDYRIDSFLSGYQRNRYWIGLNLYQSI